MVPPPLLWGRRSVLERWSGEGSADGGRGIVGR